MRTVRLNHLRAVLLAVAAAGLLGTVGLVVFLYAQPAEANYPGKPGKIAYAGGDGTTLAIYTIEPNGRASAHSPPRVQIIGSLPTHLAASG